MRPIHGAGPDNGPGFSILGLKLFSALRRNSKLAKPNGKRIQIQFGFAFKRPIIDKKKSKCNLCYSYSCQ
ncbi:hypothetical protein HanIR_Chr07g0312331 [Helianthus annuus]|nr:hypothetical protein HanIR_Chr07g0312331 [Helianthus annuus]